MNQCIYCYPFLTEETKRTVIEQLNALDKEMYLIYPYFMRYPLENEQYRLSITIINKITLQKYYIMSYDENMLFKIVNTPESFEQINPSNITNDIIQSIGISNELLQSLSVLSSQTLSEFKALCEKEGKQPEWFDEYNEIHFQILFEGY